MAGAGSTLRFMILLASDYSGSQCQLWYPSCWPSLKRRRQHWLLPRCKYHYGTFRDVLSWWSELWFTGIVHTFLCANILYKMNEIWLASPDKCYFLKATCADWPLVVKHQYLACSASMPMINNWPVSVRTENLNLEALSLQTLSRDNSFLLANEFTQIHFCYSESMPGGNHASSLCSLYLCRVLFQAPDEWRPLFGATYAV